MFSQKKLIDGIRRLTPAKQDWISKPVAQLPKTVAVSFDAGLTGVLDMKDPRAVVWAKLLDLQQRSKLPVYVEIDDETQVITLLLIPETSGVMSLDDEGEGNVDVVFFRSQARHYLRRDHPDFQQMLDALRAAMDEDKAVLFTATREDHEIIDVRSPPKSPGAVTPSPRPPPPVDDPVSPERAQELFDLMNATSCDACSASCESYPHCIPFKHADDGCYARAHEMCRLMMAEADNPAPEKVWIYGSLHVVTSNVHQCDINWGWHVAPTIMVTSPDGPDEKYVIDPSLFTTPVTVETWRDLQSETATLRYSTWEPFWSNWHMYDESEWEARGIVDTEDFYWTNHYLELKCEYLQTDCEVYGPPPYACPVNKSCHFIVDRNTFSVDEIEAMLHVGSPALIEAAFYIVADGFSPFELGFTSATMEVVPELDTTPAAVSGMSITPDQVVFEYPSYLHRRQRLTWIYTISFSDITGFTDEPLPVRMDATVDSESNSAYLYLVPEPNPYEVDGEISWLSTDLRVFQINTGDDKFGVSMGSDPSAFISEVIDNLNDPGNAGGETFEDDISVNQQTSRLELSETVDGTPVYNFAVAKVRYRSRFTQATNVRVFFRLFPWATTSLEYEQASAYRRHASGGDAIPLLGIKDGRVTSIPCFAEPRIESSTASMTTQSDAPNVQTIPLDVSGAEVVQYFGCWLDINQPDEKQFPYEPAIWDGPYDFDRESIQDHIRNEHQCFVSEITFTSALAHNGVTPSTSDKLAQRNLAIVESENPGFALSRRIPQTFEIRPSAAKLEHDELMFDWGNVPLGSVATLYLPGFDVNDILLLAVQKYRAHRLVRIDEHTLKFDTGGITYVPIPFADGSFPGMLTVDLPEGVEKGQAFNVVVRQVTGEQRPLHTTLKMVSSLPVVWRRIVGSFQLTIPVRHKAEILPGQQRLLSNLRWIERAIPANDRWLPVFGKYVSQIAARVDALGGDSSRVAPSGSGQWREAYTTCLMLTLVTVLLIATLVVGIGVLAGGLAVITGTPVFALLVGAVYLWNNKCRPTLCQHYRALFAGLGIGTVILAILALFGLATPQLIGALILSAGATVATGIVSWIKGCFR